MTDGICRLAARYPIVWHVIEADGAGEWLCETGLLPAADLRRLAGRGEERANRVDFQRLDLGGGRAAVLRPQLMPDLRLAPALSGCFAGRPELWRAHVDRHVFFWAEKRRRDGFVRACIRLRPDGAPPPLTLAFDTATLLARHASIAFYSTVNIGSTLRGGARVRRDEATLRPATAYRSGPVAELALRGSVGLRGLLHRVDPDQWTQMIRMLTAADGER